jgi:hypothetical protein
LAGDWIKITKALPDKPEVWAIAQSLNIDPDAVTGKLLRVWAWFDDQTEDGNALSVTKLLLDRQVGVNGFCDALEAVGWLEIYDNLITIPKFDRHNSATAKRRALTNERVIKSRQKRALEAESQQDSNAADVSKVGTREEKRREEKTVTIKDNSLARFSIERYTPSKKDIQYAESLLLDCPLEMVIEHFRLHHTEAGTFGNAKFWSKGFRGWVERNELPPIHDGND